MTSASITTETHNPQEHLGPHDDHSHDDHSHDEGDHGHGHHGPKYLAHHFDTPVQQFDAAKVGMWIFLAQELLFFSGLFCAYFIYRSWDPAAFSVGSHLLDWRMGTINTFVLLISSFTAAQAVRYSQIGDRKKTSLMLWVTILCACGFMVIKYFEYTHKIHLGILPGKYWMHPNFDLSAGPHPEALHELGVAVQNAAIGGGEPYHLRSFFGIYFVMTGVHGIHVLIGIGVMLWMIRRNQRREFSKEFFTPIDLTALYWHLVDLIWIFLFPLLYLID